MTLCKLFTIALTSCVLVGSTASGQTTWFVDQANCPGPGSGTQGDSFCVIQDGIDAAIDGDEVVIADGTYAGFRNTNLNFGGRLITVRSASGDPTLCTIHGEFTNRGFIFNTGETNAAIVSDLTIDTGLGPGPDGGGAFQITSASPTISNCIMVNSFTDGGAPGGSINILNGDPVIMGCTFSNSFSHSPGGAIYCDNASPAISDCVFSSSFSSAEGGAIYCAAGSNPSITDCLFENGTAITDGGAIYSASGSSPDISGCTFINNRTINGSGGAMFNIESDLQLAGSSFTGNSSPDGFGGAMFISKSSGSITGCDFEGNSAFFGGAMRLRENSSPTMEDCTFVSNVATDLNGGAIDSFGGSSPTITNCLFEANSAARFGGALVNHSQADAIISGCTFDRNHATTEGGAIFSFSSSPSISTTTFTGNTAELQGGAVYNNAANLTLDDCTFDNNQAGVGIGECPAAGDGDACTGPHVVGEGIFAESSIGNTGTDVSSCTADDTIDEWFCYTPTCTGTATADLCTNTNFDTSLAVFDACGGTELICIDDFCSLQSQVSWAVTAGTPYYVRMAGYQGAAGDFELQITCSPDVSIGDGGAVHSMNASTVIATNTSFTGNTAFDRGGAVSSENSDISFTNCTFRFNQARNGAGVFMQSATDSSLTDCTFNNNTAASFGGGVSVTVSTLAVTGCEFFQNSAVAGGGMDIFDSSLVVTASRFIENTASFAAGMHNRSGSDSIVSGCTFMGNVAASNGGGMDNLFSSPTITDCFFLNNQALDGAGIVNVSLSEPNIVNTVFSGNVALFGAAIRNLTSSPPNIVNCSFSNNTTPAGNGVIDSDTNSGPVIRNSIIWGNEGDSLTGTGSANISNSIVQGGAAGVFVFDADPLFIDADGPDDLPGTEDDDLRIRLGSPAIDFGDNASVPALVTTDLAGFDRFIDGDGDGFADVDLGAYEFDGLTTVYVLNLTQDTTSGSIAHAIQNAADADDLLAPPVAFDEEPVIDFKGKAISLRSIAAIDQASDGLIVLADGALLESGPGASISLAGELRVPSGDTADVIGDQLVTAASGEIVVRPGAGLFVTSASGATWDGDTSLFSQSTLGVSGDATNGGTMTLLSHATLAVNGLFLNTGSLGASDADFDIDVFVNAGSAVLLGITLFADQLVNDGAGTLIAYGEIIASVLNDGSATYTADTLVVGDYTNNGTTNVQGGTLTILGSLINNGTIVGDVASDSASRSALNNGLSISGDYVSGPTASILMPDPTWTVKVGGNFDVAIEDNQRYDMATAKLSISPSSSEVLTFEVMSTDIGADPSGLDRSLPGHFPIGTLHIGPGASVQLVDVHDNDALGQASCEALYVRELSIESGALLNTGSCKVYYVHVTGPGTVDDPANLRQIVILAGDADGDGQVNLQDHRSFVDCLTGPGGGLLPNCAVFDFDIDMDVDLEDFESFNVAISEQQ